MPMPAQFRYRDVFLKGKPRHDQYDNFSIRHPRMDTGHRAKIFSPFDALKGFNEAIAAKDVLYENRIEPSDEEKAELNSRLQILHNLTFNTRMARQNRVRVRVTYFDACSDVNHEAFGKRGRYETAEGICWNVDAELNNTITIDRRVIPLDDLLCIEDTSGIFAYSWEEYR